MASGQPEEDFRLLRLNAESRFKLSATGHMLAEHAPDSGPAPRLYFAGCAGGNLALVRHDVSDEIAREAQSLAAAAPPWMDLDGEPAALIALAERLEGAGMPKSAAPGLIYRLPNGLSYDIGATIVRSDTREGENLLARLARDGMPPHLAQAGFASLADFWEPWCAVLEGDAIAALGFAARNGGPALEFGVYSFPGFRGRGLAAAVTAAWSSLPQLADRTLFYSTSATNRSSQRVAQRLGLRRFGLSLNID